MVRVEVRTVGYWLQGRRPSEENLEDIVLAFFGTQEVYEDWRQGLYDAYVRIPKGKANLVDKPSLEPQEIEVRGKEYGKNGGVNSYKPRVLSKNSLWDHTDVYQEGKSFGELLDWHLLCWGTRPGCSLITRGAPWSLATFSRLIAKPHEDLDVVMHNLRNWRVGRFIPASVKRLNLIEEALFGDDPNLRTWRLEFWRAYRSHLGPNREK